MQSAQNQNEKKQEIINELIKSPKQIRATLKKTTISDRIVIVPYLCAKSNVEEIVFSRVSFCDSFTLQSLPCNKIIILDDCIFHASVQINGIKDVKIIIRNCRFLSKLQINDQQSGMIEFYDACECDVPAHTDMLFYADDVHRPIGLC